MHRGRGGGASRSAAGALQTGKFAAKQDDSLRSAKSICQGRDRKILEATDAEYLGRPPLGKELINVSLVLPGNELIPRAMDKPETLNAIRRKYQVYITRDEHHVLGIYGNSLPCLQKALKEINWAIRDMRLSENKTRVVFLLQKPTNAVISGTVWAALGDRPHFISTSPGLADNYSALDHHLPQLTSKMATSAEGLMALTKTMGLRVDFGRVIVGQRKKGTPDEITYAGLSELMGLYSSRGGGSFEYKLKNVEKAEQLVQFILQPSSGVCKSLGDIKRGYGVTVVANKLEIKTEADYPPKRGIGFTTVQATRLESFARLNWTVAAPDMQYDWSFRVDAWDQIDVPLEFKDLAKRVLLVVSLDGDAFLPVLNVNTAKLAMLDEEITEIRAGSWAVVPFKETDYVLKINVTKILKGVRTAEKAEVTWGVELYAPHWEENVNHASGGRKDWGKGLENIWMEGHDLESRLGCFMRTILEVQALLNKATANATLI
ncbi:hypothetical protein FHETE_7876 [Fusarium heterosporum]|uniref:Uncharacterized protein n=1 Tax=Fusarium heterosporum TaxID=42747 RepID=A0A8H5T3L9_FUSHE|nr:hypothetical protein FHETE_7876 [Fusarium heterosporum]